MKRALCWTIILGSNVLIVWLFVRLLGNGHLWWTSLMYVIGPVVFSLPWYVILGEQK